MKKRKRIFNYAGGRGKIHVIFNAADESPAEIMICEDIGHDAWTGEGIGVKDISAALNAITPRTRELNFLTNSQGGCVSEGVAIRNILNQWPGKITNTIIGIAASTASWCIPADEVRAYKSSQMFMHKAWGVVAGNADDMRSAVEFLETTDRQIADMYADQSGKTPDEMMSLMAKETLLTGEEAMNLGLVNVLVDGEAKNQFSKEWINAAKSKLAALNTLRSTEQGATNNKNNEQEQPIMNKTQMLALLKNWGVTVPDNATDEKLVELINAGKPIAPPPVIPPPTPGSLNEDDRALINRLRAENATNRRNGIRTTVQTAASNGKIPVLEIENWVTDADAAIDDPTNGNPVLRRLNALPERAPGVPPLSDSGVEITGESFQDVQKFVIANGPGFRRQFLGRGAQNEIDGKVLKEIGSRAMIVANKIAKHKTMLTSMFNANAIDSDLQRQLILQDMLEAYALTLLPLEAFSIKYENVPLQGTDEVVVPYFPLQTNASVQFVAGTGYTTVRDWTQNSRKVIVGGDGAAASSGSNATAGYAKDRLYIAINFTSYDMRRQPYLNVMKLGQQAANKLGVDIFSQIVSRVIVTGTYGAAVKTVAAALFSPDDLADLEQIASTAEWPAIARSLVLTNTYKTPLLKDNTFKQYLSYGSTDPIRKAMIQEAYGFQDMYFVPNLASRLATNVVGWINHKSAVLVAFAPIMPTPEVRNLLTTYDVAVEPRSGAVLEYRKFGNATTDTTQEVIESSFGAGPGVEAALKIIKSA